MDIRTSEPDLRALMISGLDGDAAAHRALLERLSGQLRAYFKGQLNRIGTVPVEADKNGFYIYINDRKFAPDASPMTSVRVGTYQHWGIVNRTAELHPSDIH